jgi:hypothetical protein
MEAKTAKSIIKINLNRKLKDTFNKLWMLIYNTLAKRLILGALRNNLSFITMQR